MDYGDDNGELSFQTIVRSKRKATGGRATRFAMNRGVQARVLCDPFEGPLYFINKLLAQPRQLLLVPGCRFCNILLRIGTYSKLERHRRLRMSASA